MENTKNLHHVFWPRRGYKSTFDKRFRTNGNFVVPTLIKPHETLHYEMNPPKKPSRDLMYDILDNLETGLHIQKLDGLFSTVEFLSEIDTREAQNLTNHLTRQLGYLANQEVEHGNRR